VPVWRPHYHLLPSYQQWNFYFVVFYPAGEPFSCFSPYVVLWQSGGGAVSKLLNGRGSLAGNPLLSVPVFLVDCDKRRHNFGLRSGPIGPEVFLISRVCGMPCSTSAARPFRAVIKYVDFSLCDQWWFSATISNWRRNRPKMKSHRIMVAVSCFHRLLLPFRFPLWPRLLRTETGTRD
jgi:hypothetical protein